MNLTNEQVDAIIEYVDSAIEAKLRDHYDLNHVQEQDSCAGLESYRVRESAGAELRRVLTGKKTRK